MSQQLDRLEQKIDKLDERLDLIKEELHEYNIELKVHIEGVEQNRLAVREIAKQVLPIQTHVVQVQAILGLFKWLGAGGVIAAATALAKYFGAF